MSSPGAFPETVDEMRRETRLPVVVADHHGIIRYINRPFQEAWGWTPEELAGQSLTRIIPPALHDAHNLGISRFLATGQPTLLGTPLTLAIVTPDGREVPAEHVIVGAREEGEWVFAATIRPLP